MNKQANPIAICKVCKGLHLAPNKDKNYVCPRCISEMSKVYGKTDKTN